MPILEPQKDKVYIVDFDFHNGYSCIYLGKCASPLAKLGDNVTWYKFLSMRRLIVKLPQHYIHRLEAKGDVDFEEWKPVIDWYHKYSDDYDSYVESGGVQHFNDYVYSKEANA